MSKPKKMYRIINNRIEPITIYGRGPSSHSWNGGMIVYFTDKALTREIMTVGIYATKKSAARGLYRRLNEKVKWYAAEMMRAQKKRDDTIMRVLEKHNLTPADVVTL